MTRRYLIILQLKSMDNSKKIRLFLTGGSGFLGQEIIKKINQKNSNNKYEIIIFDLIKPDNSYNVKYIYGDLLDIDNLMKVFNDLKFNESDILIHIAGIHPTVQIVNKIQNEKLIQVNCLGTDNLLKSASKFIKNYIYISSESVHKDSCYGFTKLYCELKFDEYLKNKQIDKCCSLRFRSFAPVEDKIYNGDYIAWAKKFLAGAVHISDAALAVVKALESMINLPFYENVKLTIDGKYDDKLFQFYWTNYKLMMVQFNIPQIVSKKKNNEATKILGYIPEFEPATVLSKLATIWQNIK